VVDLERWLNLAFGRTRADDTLPRRYFDEPMPARATQGHRIERDKFERMLDEYYAARGWDAAGRLRPERERAIEGGCGAELAAVGRTMYPPSTWPLAGGARRRRRKGRSAAHVGESHAASASCRGGRWWYVGLALVGRRF
jgi:hypothetical protein